MRLKKKVRSVFSELLLNEASCGVVHTLGLLKGNQSLFINSAYLLAAVSSVNGLQRASARPKQQERVKVPDVDIDIQNWSAKYNV